MTFFGADWVGKFMENCSKSMAYGILDGSNEK